jgi:hypothetical protein
MDKKKTLKEMRDEIQRMIEASQRRQKGEKVTSEDIKKNPIGTRAKGRPENFRTDVDMGIKAQKSKDYSKAKTSGTYMDSNNKPNPPKDRRDEKPRQRPGSGKERMMAKAEEERKRRKNGESAVVGS